MHAIPKTVSSPTDANTSPFLTDLSPEIRNTVYEILLKRECPILLHNTAAFHTLLPDPTEAADVMDSYYKAIECEIVSGQDFCHGFEGATSLLLTCRQIYHEAAGVLYGKNSFVISRVSNRHDYDNNLELSDRDQESYFQTTYACAWLIGLGSQVHLLQKVVIDVDTMCPTNCNYMIPLNVCDILPLMRLLWESPELSKVIGFGHSGRSLSVHDDSSSDFDGWAEDPETPIVDLAKVLNNLLVTLVAEDALDIKRYRKFAHLLSCVGICPRAEHIVVHFKPSETRAGIAERIWMFKMSDGGKTVARNPRQPPNLLTLPKRIKVRIFKFASYNPNGMIFDMSTRKLQGIEMGMFQVNKKMRRYYNRVVAQVNIVTIKLTSTDTVTDFDNFRSLQKTGRGFLSRAGFPYYHTSFAHYDSYKPSKIPEGWKPKKTRPPTILLKIESPTTSTLSDVRINIKGLLSVLCDSDIHNEATLRIALECPWGTRTRTETDEVRIKALRTKLFLLLSDLITQGGTTSDILHPAADIFIDGHGTPLSASIFTVAQRLLFSVRYDHAGLNAVEIQARGHQKAAGLVKYRNCFAKIDESKPVLLIDQWISLRCSAYPDWKFQAGRQLRVQRRRLH